MWFRSCNTVIWYATELATQWIEDQLPNSCVAQNRLIYNALTDYQSDLRTFLKLDLLPTVGSRVLLTRVTRGILVEEDVVPISPWNMEPLCFILHLWKGPLFNCSERPDSGTSKISLPPQAWEWVSERTCERSEAREWSEQCGASECVSGASKRENERMAQYSTHQIVYIYIFPELATL